MEGKEQENIKGLEKEMHKVTGLLSLTDYLLLKMPIEFYTLIKEGL